MLSKLADYFILVYPTRKQLRLDKILYDNSVIDSVGPKLELLSL